MKNQLTIALKIILAVVAGYVVMILLITLVQEVIFGGVSYHNSSLPVLSIAGIGTMLAGAVGGWLAGIIYKNPKLVAPIIIAVLTVVETTYLTQTGILEGPLWFDILAEAGLFLGIISGGFVSLQSHSTEQTAPQEA